MKLIYIKPETELVVCRTTPILEGSNKTNWGIGGEDPDDPTQPIGGDQPDPNEDAKQNSGIWEDAPQSPSIWGDGE